jgi:hypothetical protein
MSFDTEFNYSEVTIGLTRERDNLDSRLTSINAEKALLMSAPAYLSDPVVAARIESIDREVAALTTQKNNITDVLAEITVVNGLSSEAKASLYYFYTIVEVSKQDFMAKTLYNHVAALADPRIIALQADNVTSAEAKTAVAKLVYGSYSISQAKIGAIMGVYRYVR